ncbi:MAG: UvrD-helicase domain-containing protein, partial [Symbiobacteriaceae bacterium]
MGRERPGEHGGPAPVAAAAEDVNVGTIHSFCFRILREEWRAQGIEYDVLDDRRQKRIMQEILGPRGPKNPWGLNLDETVMTAPEALAMIGRLKNDLITPDRYAEQAESGDPLVDVYWTYERRKEQERLVDFDDMLLLCYRLLNENPAILRSWQRRWTWVLVDEFQDTNRAQWEILRLLAAPENNLFVVGDDWQAIYGWRGARPELIVRFRDHYPDARVIVLDTNYRSVPSVVEAGNRLIRFNPDQYPKVVRASRAGHTEPQLIIAADEDDEAALVATEIEALVAEGLAYRDIAVLVRTNRQTRAFEDAFVARNIPYVVAGAVGFYRRREVQDLLAYLRLLVDPHDDEACKRVFNVPSRFLGAAYQREVEAYAISQGLSFFEAMDTAPGLKDWQRRRAAEFVRLILELRERYGSARPSDALVAIRQAVGYDDWLRREEQDEADNRRLENVQELTAAAGRFSTIPDFLAYADMMASRTRDADDESGDKVHVLTIHRSKGLEWTAVFLAGVADGLLPHARAESLAEERRLCYVGITRARDRLYVLYPATYNGRYRDPSRFLAEMGLPVPG